jgi:hypothetical protein
MPSLTRASKAAKVYNYLLNVSIITRWTLFIVPVLGLLWIPGILGLTVYKEARVRDHRIHPISVINLVNRCGMSNSSGGVSG